jgi:alginate O-acetyltransferase complex protein AlgJ
MQEAAESLQRIRTVKDAVLIIIFVAALCLPLMGMVFRLDVISEQQENRRLATPPSIPLDASALDAFPAKFKGYFNDHFGFRQTLVRWHANLKVNWLGVSSSPLVILGKDGWLFYADEFSPEGRRSVSLFTPRELEHWRLSLEARRDWLAQRGIRYLFTIAPHKQTIYPEYLPDTLTQAAKESRLKQLTAYLKEHSNLEFLDLRPALYEAKARHILFPKTDSHWNFYAGFVAYQAIIRELAKSFPGLRPVAESDLEVTTMKAAAGDLALFLGLANPPTEQRPLIGLRKPSYVITKLKELEGNTSVEQPAPSAEKLQYRLVASKTPFVANKVTFLATERKGTNLPRVVLFHDSAAVYLIPFFPESFSRAVLSWTPVLDLDLVKSERPDIVVQEMGEMFLMAPPPTDWPEIRRLLTNSRRKAAPGASLAPPNYAGFHDVADCEQIYGWAWDRNNPHAVLDVEIYDGETLLDTVAADIYREDLLQAGIGSGEHGFSTPLPSALRDGRPHSIRVKVAGSNFNLKNTPKSLTCAPK